MMEVRREAWRRKRRERREGEVDSNGVGDSKIQHWVPSESVTEQQRCI